MVGNVFGKTIGHIKITVAIIIKISDQGAPTPIGFCYACKKTYITKNRIPNRIILLHSCALIQLNAVTNILVLIAIIITVLKILITNGIEHHFFSVIVLWIHVQFYHIYQSIVVDIDDVLAHAIGRSMFKVGARFICKSTVMVIDVK